MSCKSDKIRQWEWADELWGLIQGSASMEEFATKLLAFAQKLNKEVNGQRKKKKRLNGHHSHSEEGNPSVQEIPPSET